MLKLFLLMLFMVLRRVQPNPLAASRSRLTKTSNGCLLQDQSCDSDLVDCGAFVFVASYTEWRHPVQKLLRSISYDQQEMRNNYVVLLKLVACEHVINSDRTFSSYC